ncbi:MAG TPA: hypothetical protein VGE74_32820 [Gemmata sp.]
MNPLEAAFPGLVGTDYRVTSPTDDGYNCIAWAASEADRWWWPDPLGTSFWPDGVPRAETPEAFAAAYATAGFVPAADGSLQPDVEKVAVYMRGGRPTHAARQLVSGRWTSKLGRAEDIEHDLSALEGDVYGTVGFFLQRPRPTPGPATATE